MFLSRSKQLKAEQISTATMEKKSDYDGINDEKYINTQMKLKRAASLVRDKNL